MGLAFLGERDGRGRDGFRAGRRLNAVELPDLDDLLVEQRHGRIFPDELHPKQCQDVICALHGPLAGLVGHGEADALELDCQAIFTRISFQDGAATQTSCPFSARSESYLNSWPRLMTLS